MNTIRYYSFALACLLVCSCGNDFLDLKPISNVTTDLFYRTEADFKTAVNGAYGSLQRNGISTNSYVFGEITSDNTQPVVSGSVTTQDEFDLFHLITTNTLIAERWNDSYAAIAKCNTILSRIGGIEINETVKNQYIMEVKFIRALVYFNLVRTYGNVPLVLAEIRNPQEGYAYGRNLASEVYAQIESDLKDAEGLPVQYPAADVGRATRGAAKALLGKVYLTQALSKPANYTLAAEKLKEVIDLGVYDLLPAYADVFRVSNKNHKESVFDIQFKSGTNLGEGNPWPNSFAPQNSNNAVVQFGGSGNNTPTTDMEMAYEAGDLRKTFSMATSYVTSSGQTIPYYFVRKYRDTPPVVNDNGNNIPIIRYADVLLMYAEALNEIGYQGGGDSFKYLNDVRRRAGLAAKTPADLPDKQSFKMAVEQERRVELAFEGHRWFDLVRTGRALAVMNSKRQLFNIKNELTENNLLFPIPESQIQLNRDKIKQNDGY